MPSWLLEKKEAEEAAAIAREDAMTLDDLLAEMLRAEQDAADVVEVIGARSWAERDAALRERAVDLEDFSEPEE